MLAGNPFRRLEPYCITRIDLISPFGGPILVHFRLLTNMFVFPCLDSERIDHYWTYFFREARKGEITFCWARTGRLRWLKPTSLIDICRGSKQKPAFLPALPCSLVVIVSLSSCKAPTQYVVLSLLAVEGINPSRDFSSRLLKQMEDDACVAHLVSIHTHGIRPRNCTAHSARLSTYAYLFFHILITQK